MKRNPLLTAMESRRDELGMNDVGFARHLGINQAIWHGLQHGHVGFGTKTLAAVMKKEPNLAWALLLMLTEGPDAYHNGRMAPPAAPAAVKRGNGARRKAA